MNLLKKDYKIPNNLEWMHKKKVRIITESEYMKLLEFKFRYIELKELICKGLQIRSDE